MGAVAIAPELRRRSDRLVLLRLRRRAVRKSRTASRIAVLRLRGLPHEEARARMGVSVAEYKRARRWLDDAAQEADASDGLLTLDEALAAYSERHLEGVTRVGLAKDLGRSETLIRQHLQISEQQYRIALEWWRDAMASVRRDQDGDE